MSFWTTDREDLLIKLRTDLGLTSGQIARHLGCTRNAVIGKLHRLDKTVPRERSYPRTISIRHKNRLSYGKPENQGFHKGPRVVPETIAGTATRCSLHDLEAFDRRCRYPHGDAAPYTFCGGVSVPGSSYCLAHLQACYQTPPRAAAAHIERQLEGVAA